MFQRAKRFLFNRWHYMIIDENEVVPALRILAAATDVPEAQKTLVRHAGWPHKPERWYISFTCYNREWASLEKKLTSTLKSIEVLR